MFKIISSVLTAVSIMLIPSIASAHVEVSPSKTGIGKESIYTVSVSNEKAVAVTNLRLAIPDGVTDVTPTTKQGWKITADKSTGQSTEIAAITWSDGTIPVGQRQDFTFSAQAPPKATNLTWKAYQTYADGTVVHWDQKPAESDESTNNAGPYSVTKVVDDLSSPASRPETTSQTSPSGSYILAGIALVVAVVGLLTKRK